MAQCKLSPQDFIKNAFTPQIAVMTSPQAEVLCQKNNLSFVELLQPFSKISSEVFYKDATSLVITVKNLKLTLLDINSRPPETALARRHLNSSVSEAPEPRTHVVKVGERDLEIPMSTPWFEAWRETFLMVQYPSDHEYTKHFLACMLVVSSIEQEPQETLNKMTQTFNHIVNNSQGSLPKWFNSNVLKYYVLLHDNVEGNNDQTEQIYETIRVQYAPNTFLLRINSRIKDAVINERLADPWSQFIISNVMSQQSEQKSPSSLTKSVVESMSASSLIEQLDTLEIGQEANEGKVDSTTYHPLSPAREDMSVALLESTTDAEKPIFKTAELKQHGLCLSPEDVERVKYMLFEFARSSLMPYLERQIQQLNEAVQTKKGVSRSLFTATKRWFNPNKPGSSSGTANLTYVSDSPELQVRKLGDLYFMFNHYSGAFHAYHYAKRDFNADQAWLYCAGALEMASLAAFMAGEASKKTSDYMEEAITTYLNACKLPQFATRATLLSTECLKSRGMYGEAAHQFIRMTSEDSDLRSALLLEQAAYCFLHNKMIRKYAFHMVLAGHRFSKAAQRKHSLRCYNQARQIYEGSGWDLAEDHINYTIGRQANNLQYYGEAVDSFAKMLAAESRQTGEQQTVFLKEYLTILEHSSEATGECKSLTEESKKASRQNNLFLKQYLTILENKYRKTGIKENVILPVPHVDNSSIKLLTVPAAPLMTPGKCSARGVNFDDDLESDEEIKWLKLEDLVVQEAQGGLPMLFKPMISLYDKNRILKTKPITIIHEPIRMSINLVNNLQIPLNLKDIQLVWSFVCLRDTQGVSIACDSPEADTYIKTHVLKTAVIPENSSKPVILILTPLATGYITVSGIEFTLTSSGGQETLYARGRQLFGQSNPMTQVGNKMLSEIQITVVPPAPCLQVLFTEVNSEFLCDEIQRVIVHFQNTGAVPLNNIHMATSVPNLITNCEFGKDCNYTLKDCDGSSVRDKLGRKNHVIPVPLPNRKLLPGHSYSVPIWIRAPDKKGSALIDLLIYYENVMKNSIPRYRLVRHSWTLSISESIQIETAAKMSHTSKSEEEITIPITITNLNKTHYSYCTEIALLGTGLLSKCWRLVPSLTTPSYINLHEQESAHLLVRAKRYSSNKTAFCTMAVNPDSITESLANASKAFAVKTDKTPINLFDDTDALPVDLVENKNGVLVIQWQALIIEASKKRNVIGQSHLPLEIIRRKKEPYEDMEESWMLTDFTNLVDENRERRKAEEKKKALQTQVTYNLIYPPSVEKDFSRNDICIVKVILYLHSLIEEPVSVTINTLKPMDEELPDNATSLFCTNASGSFRWVGKAKFVLTLQPLTNETVDLYVALPRSGTYDLGAHVQVFCAKLDEPENNVLQTTKIQSTLVVVDTSS